MITTEHDHAGAGTFPRRARAPTAADRQPAPDGAGNGAHAGRFHLPAVCPARPRPGGADWLDAGPVAVDGRPAAGGKSDASRRSAFRRSWCLASRRRRTPAAATTSPGRHRPARAARHQGRRARPDRHLGHVFLRIHRSRALRHYQHARRRTLHAGAAGRLPAQRPDAGAAGAGVGSSIACAGADMIAPSGMIDGMVGGDSRGAGPAMAWRHVAINELRRQIRQRLLTARSATRPKARPSSATAASIRWTPPTAARRSRKWRSTWPRARTLLMVKPALPYLDVLSAVRRAYNLPTAAYQVSGEYAMLQAAAANGWIDLRRCALESLTSIKARRRRHDPDLFRQGRRPLAGRRRSVTAAEPVEQPAKTAADGRFLRALPGASRPMQRRSG